MFTQKIIRKETFFSLILYGMFILFLILVVENKKDLNVDEVLSYGLSNHVGSLVIEEGRTYYPSNEFWLDYMTVDERVGFHYGNVWKNQAADVHPPLYYMILHSHGSKQHFPVSATL